MRERLDGFRVSIAAAFASGDRGAISDADEVTMRDAGLTHLLSGAILTLRVRMRPVAACVAAAAGIGYTFLTGAQVPAVRSCVVAVLALDALELGREPLSMRMVADAAGVVFILWL